MFSDLDNQEPNKGYNRTSLFVTVSNHLVMSSIIVVVHSSFFMVSSSFHVSVHLFGLPISLPN